MEKLSNDDVSTPQQGGHPHGQSPTDLPDSGTAHPGRGGQLAGRHPGAGHPGGSKVLNPRDRQSFRIALRIREINALANARIAEALASSGLTMPQITAIRLVAHAGSRTMSQICVEMNASPSTVAGIIDRLEAAGILERKRSEVDRRVINVHLAAAGSEKALFARQAMDTCFSKAFEAIAEAELADIERGLDIVLNAFRGEGTPS
ncbi:MAG: MarR family winged helix-turn-helix transcriptional regulator [Rectinemataceae bacterium]